jgi:beta-carotene 3-hydroxylase
MMGVLITLATYIAMEGITWCTHKFVMHGWMWYFHEDHHKPTGSFFEKNDAFFLIFAVPSCLLIVFDGVSYFLIHDVLIHQRFDWFSRTDNLYFRAIRKAHKVHHKHLNKEHGECFGMLYVPRKYFIEAANYRKNIGK